MQGIRAQCSWPSHLFLAGESCLPSWLLVINLDLLWLSRAVSLRVFLGNIKPAVPRPVSQAVCAVSCAECLVQPGCFSFHYTWIENQGYFKKKKKTFQGADLEPSFILSLVENVLILSCSPCSTLPRVCTPWCMLGSQRKGENAILPLQQEQAC